MIEIILLTLGLMGLVIATITDLKTREVPDMLNYGLIAAGIILWALKSIIEWNPTYIINSVIGFVAFFLIGVLMFYTGQWGGGDSKMLMALGAIFPVYPQILNVLFSPRLQFPFIDKQIPFLLIFLLNLVICGALYGFAWSMILAIKNRKEFMQNLKEFMQKKTVYLTRIVIIVLTIIMIILMLIFRDITTILFGLALFIVFSTFYVWVIVKVVEQTCMYKKVTPEKLTEGDWIAEEVKIKNKIIASPKDLGVSKEQISALIKLKKEGKISKILIKIGIPFVPSFLMAFIITIIYGNIIMFTI